MSFNSTRYIRNKQHNQDQAHLRLRAFNSTRYIRNKQHNQDQAHLRLRAFNSTRYIRNKRLKGSGILTSLFAFNSTRYIRNLESITKAGIGHLTFNSTRYIRNQLNSLVKVCLAFLSTPHGTLGTFGRGMNPYATKIFQLHTVH